MRKFYFINHFSYLMEVLLFTTLLYIKALETKSESAFFTFANCQLVPRNPKTVGTLQIYISQWWEIQMRISNYFDYFFLLWLFSNYSNYTLKKDKQRNWYLVTNWCNETGNSYQFQPLWIALGSWDHQVLWTSPIYSNRPTAEKEKKKY